MSAPQAGEQVLRGERDRLVQRADRRRVHVLHGGELAGRDPGPDGHGQEIRALLDALGADHLRADQPQRAREIPSATPTTCGMPSAVASVSLNETPPIIHSPATIPHGTLTGWYARWPPAALVPATLPWA